jgi:hypothetical protein
MAESLDALVDRILGALPAADVASAREAFAARTGTFSAEEPFYEERLRAAFDDALTAWGSPPGVLLARWLERHDEPRAAAMARSWRSLFSVASVEDGALVRAPLTGGELRLSGGDGPASRLRQGDLFEGRVFVHDGAVLLMPGAIFFERDVHQAIDVIVAEAARHRRDSDALCDSLLRMQMRLFRQPALRVHHVYRWDAFDRTEILAAPWARPRR